MLPASETTFHISATAVEMTQIVLPTFTNNLGTVFGGQIAAWIDVCAAVSAQRFCRGPVVTASMDELHFLRPARQGMVVILHSMVNRSWSTSVEVGVRVDAEDPFTGIREHTCSAYLTFVAVDPDGKPRAVPQVDFTGIEGAERRWQEAAMRRDARLKMREMRRAADG